MTKKVRRVKKKRSPKTQVPNGEADVKASAAAEQVVEQTLSATEQFRFDYAYVVKDLRRVMILAASMFALLIILNLILQ